MLLCRSVFSDRPKTHACLRVREALSVSREGEGACDNYVCLCACVCVCLERQGQRGWGVGGLGLEGSQMEIAGPTERPAIVWPSSASFYLVSVYE